MALTHSFDEIARDALDLPYDVAIGGFRGGWTAAADSYKAWANEQWWVTQARTKSTADRLSRTAVGIDFGAQKCGDGPDKSYSEFGRRLDDAKQYFQTSILGMFWGWERYGAWYYGDYFPPSESWSSFDQTMAAIHNAGHRAYLFISPWFLETSTGLWKSGQLRPSAIADRSANVRTSTDGQGRTWAFMDPSTSDWQRHIMDAGTTLATHGVDIIQLDGLPWTKPQGCYSAGHGHPAGAGGTWQTRAWFDFLPAFRDAVRTAKADVVISGRLLPSIHRPFRSNGG